MQQGTTPRLAALTTFAVTLAFGLTLCLLFEPMWQSNDDVAMAMVSGGFGLAAGSGSPNILFSNVIWGEFVRVIPAVAGVSGYALATLISIFAAAWGIFYFLVRLREGYLVGFLALVLVFSRPLLFPQFTLNAGLLTVASVLALFAYLRFGETLTLVCAVILAFAGFLVRREEFALVLLVALPLLPWRILKTSRPLQLSLGALAILVLGATAIDWAAYRTPQWEAFQAINKARLPMTDFGAAPLLLQRPDLLAKYGYSENDVLLLRDWFFADMALLDPPRLQGMIDELGPLSVQSRSLALGWSAETTLADPQLLALVLAAVALIAMRPNWRLGLALLVMLLALFAIGAAGRPGVVRVYYPLVSLLLLVPIARPESGVRSLIQVLILIAAVVGCFYVLLPQASKSRSSIEQARSDVDMLPAETIYSWGGLFPYEKIFPVLGTARPDLHIFALGVSTYAPYSFASAEIAAGRGMVERMAAPGGILLVSDRGVSKLLGTYCREHLDAMINASVYLRTASFSAWRVSCVAAPRAGRNQARSLVARQ
jgi:hypothetical protein